MVRRALIFATSLAALISSTAVATNSTDPCVALTARALGFIRDRHLDNVRVALVRDPDSPQSTEEAAQIRAAFGNGIAIANMHLVLIDLPISKIEDASGVDVFWITKGLKDDYKRVVSVAKREHALSVSSDLSCAKEGICVLGVQAEPSVKIILSASAASEAGISFQPAFRMMVTERQ